MIVCLIEFETRPGQESAQQKWLAELMPEVGEIEGFRGKESYAHVSGDRRVSTVSYWENEESLKAWTRHPRHREAMREGKETIFARYDIRICEQLRRYCHPE